MSRAQPMPSASESPALRRIAGPGCALENGLSKRPIATTLPLGPWKSRNPGRDVDLVGDHAYMGTNASADRLRPSVLCGERTRFRLLPGSGRSQGTTCRCVGPVRPWTIGSGPSLLETSQERAHFAGIVPHGAV